MNTMYKNELRVSKPVLIAAILATTVWVSAGDLNPPAGPIAPTQRTPIGGNTTPGDNDASPSLYKISSPGSYYLTGNITGVSGKIGIEIASSAVTLDLMGFDLMGVAGSWEGVLVTVNQLIDVEVRNGTVRNWGRDGVDLASTGNVRLADLRVSANTMTGIIAAQNAIVTGCTVRGNGTEGIFVGNASVITGCSSMSNGSTGLFVGNGGMIVDNVAYGNTGDGIQFGGSCIIRANTSTANGVGAGSGAGIRTASDNSRIEGNTCTLNDRGINVNGTGNLVIRNSCSDNSVLNWEVVAGNVILVVNATAAGAVNGNSGGVAPGSTDPNANFTY